MIFLIEHIRISGKSKITTFADHERAAAQQLMQVKEIESLNAGVSKDVLILEGLTLEAVKKSHPTFFSERGDTQLFQSMVSEALRLRR